jgi:hypothetical protein
VVDPRTGEILGHHAGDDGAEGGPPPALDVLGGGPRPPALVLDPQPPGPTSLSSGRDTVVPLSDGVYRVPVFAGGFATWVMRAVPDRRAALGYRFQTVGRLGGVLASACFATARYLACATALGVLTVYSLPPDRS